MVAAIFFACLLSAALAQDTKTSPLPPRENSILSAMSGVGRFISKASTTVNKELMDLKHPVQVAITSAVFKQCTRVKKMTGVTYEQVKGNKEPDINQLSLNLFSNDYSISYKISRAAQAIPAGKDYNPHQNLYIFIHGFTDNPTKASFKNISSALFSRGLGNVLGLDGSPLIRWLYLRSTTYVRLIGEKLGEVLASMVQSGVDPAQIHIIGHSLGAHISGFTGKTFTKLTGLKVGRISGLDPAGPCFDHVEDDGLRLKKTDAEFVDVIHTDAGVFGITDAIGDVDYFPNDGSQQPNCLSQQCSHSRAWLYFTESVVNPEAFPAIKCDSWDAFKNSTCENTTSYMGFPSKPGTTGLYYLQTAGETPFGLGPNGTRYRNKLGIVKNVREYLFSSSTSSAFKKLGSDMSVWGLYIVLFSFILSL